MNTTEQSAAGNAQKMDIANFLRAADSKPAGKTKTGSNAFDALLTEKSQALGKGKRTGDASGKETPAPSARNAEKDGTASSKEARKASKGKAASIAAGLKSDPTAQKKTPAASEVTSKETPKETMAPQLDPATACHDLQLAAAIAGTAGSGENLPEKDAPKPAEQTLFEALPAPSAGSIQTEEPLTLVGSAGLPQGAQTKDGANPVAALAAPEPTLQKETGKEFEIQASRNAAPDFTDRQPRSASGADQQTALDALQKNRPVPPSQTIETEPAPQTNAADLSVEGAPAVDSRISAARTENEAGPRRLAEQMPPEETPQPILSGRQQAPAGEPTLSPGTEARTFDGVAGKVGTPAPEASLETPKGLQAVAGTPAVDAAARSSAEKAQTLRDAADPRQNANPDRPASTGTTGTGAKDAEQTAAAGLSRVQLRRDETQASFTSKETFYFAAETAKKSLDAAKGPKDAPAPRISLGEEAEARQAAFTRTVPLKETLTAYAAAAQTEKERPKAATSRAHNEEKVSTLAGMTAGENSPLSGQKVPPTDSLAAVKSQALIDQIAEARQQMASDSGRIKITLTPPNLGTVDLDIIVRQNRVDVVMVADQSEVQQLLQARGEDIKSALQRQDMKIDSYQVLLQSGTDGNQGQTGSWTATQDPNREEYAHYHDRQGDDDVLAAAPEPLSTPQHNGIVSVFA